VPGATTAEFLQAAQNARVSPFQGGTPGTRKGGQVKHRTHADTRDLVLPAAHPGSPPQPVKVKQAQA
jgi:hypothetical protein